MSSGVTAARDFFKRQFQHLPAALVSAPGCVNLLGQETESHQGLVLSAAIGHHVRAAVSPRTDGWIEMAHSEAPARERFPANRFETNPAAAWADPIKAVLAQLRRRGIHFSGFNASFHATLPAGLGLHRASATAVASALAVRQLHPFALTDVGVELPPRRDAQGRVPAPEARERMHLARLCANASREFLRQTPSLAALLTILCGKSFHALNVDCRFETLTPLPLIGEVLVVCDSGAPPESKPGGVADVRNQLDSAARWLRTASLRSVDPAYLKENRARLSRREYECAYHVVGELQRVVYSERALREEDHGQFGQFLVQSHHSARDFFRNSTPELDRLVELATAHTACLGSRLTGPGFGGSTVSLVPYHDVQRFVTDLAGSVQTADGNKLKPLICPIAEGAE